MRPPPNYFSRGVQLRLLVLVALLMSVLLLLPQAADPDNYAWMGFEKNADSGSTSHAVDSNTGEGESAADAAAEDASEEPDTRISPENLAAAPFESRPVEVSPESLTAEEPRDALYLAKKDAWNELLAGMTRSQFDLIARALRSLRYGEALGEEDRADWLTMLDVFDERLGEHLEQARGSIAGLPSSEQQSWSDVLAQLDSNWSEELKPALMVALEDRRPTPDEAAAIGDFQSLLDRLALARVVDDKPYQAVERDAWFRLLEMLEHSTLDELERQSVGEVGYLQLYKQPQEYRGKLVTIRGRARQAYQVDAPDNDFGIESYQVFWIRPEGGVNSPVVVYALERPEGFPELGPQSAADASPIDEPVEITGFFLKRWAYPAQDGPRTAPLMLARSPRWERPPVEGRPWYSSTLLVALCALGAVLTAAGVCLYAYRASGRSSAPPLNEAKDADLKALESVETAPTVEQSLRQLAQGKQAP
jgi:hypothetical protein